MDLRHKVSQVIIQPREEEPSKETLARVSKGKGKMVIDFKDLKEPVEHSRRPKTWFASKGICK